MPQTVLILGASGKIGRHTTHAFRSAGWTIRLFDREKDDMIAAAQGCSLIVNGLNPPNYENWNENIPRITRMVIAAAKASGATILIPGNVYVFGAQGGVWSEETPHRPNTKKGKVRAEMEAAYRAAARHGVQTIILRAGDFIDPEGNGTLLGLVTLAKLDKGKIIRLGGADVTRVHCYLPDFARAAVALAGMKEYLNAFEDIPFPGHSFTIKQLKQVIESHTGRPLKVDAFPWWFLHLASPFWGLAREMREMRYLYETDHQLSGKRLTALLPEFNFTDRETALLAEVPRSLAKTAVQTRAA